MNRRNRLLVVIAIATVLATVASWAAYQAIARRPVVEVQISERKMVVASQAVDVGMILGEQHVKLIPWPAAAPVAGGFEKVTDVVGRAVMAPLVANEVIIEGKLASREGGAGLTPQIPAGMRAMSVRVNDVIGVAGFAVPGTRVDVVVTIRGQNESTSRVVVNNVKVLASGIRTAAGAGREGAPPAANVVTLEVTPQDAERLALAQSQGSILLALRNPMDTTPVETGGVRTSGLLAAEPVPGAAPVRTGPPRPRVVAPPPPPPPPAARTIETIKGTVRSEVVIKSGGSLGQ